MKRFLKATIGLVAIVAIAGCAGGQSPSASLGLGPQSDRPEVVAALDHDTDFASTNFIVQGAVAGAVVGCGLGLLLGGKAKNCLAGAAVGAVGGGVAGAAVAEGNKKQILAEDQEDRLYAELNAEGEDLRAYNSKVETAIARLDSDLKNLETRRRKKQVNAETYEAEYSSIKRDSAKLAEHAREQREEVEERNASLEDYDLSKRNAKVQKVNFSLVFDSADSTADFDRRATNAYKGQGA